MSFDARSKERLEALGRTLPKKLPLPEPLPQAGASRGPLTNESAPSGARAQRPSPPVKETPRHRLEREQDPAELFRALITASPDGTVPPHLLDRLRDLETPRQPAAGVMATGQAPATPGSPRARATPKGSTSAGKRGGSRTPAQGRASEDEDLYTAFAQLLLEDDGD